MRRSSPCRIERLIGRPPMRAFGNSMAIGQMLEWTDLLCRQRLGNCSSAMTGREREVGLTTAASRSASSTWRRSRPRSAGWTRAFEHAQRRRGCPDPR